MTPQESAREKAAVMLAFAEGKAIEWQYRQSQSPEVWHPFNEASWNWDAFDYRIKREPRIWWMNLYGEKPGGLVYASQEEANERSCHDRTECIRVREVL